MSKKRRIFFLIDGLKVKLGFVSQLHMQNNLAFLFSALFLPPSCVGNKLILFNSLAASPLVVKAATPLEMGCESGKLPRGIWSHKIRGFQDEMLGAPCLSLLRARFEFPEVSWEDGKEVKLCP